MLTKKILVSALKKMLEIRLTEKLIAEDYIKSNIKSFLHLSIGQEATATAISYALNKKDLFFGNHRSHGHYLAKNGNWKKMVYEIYGDSRGCCKGYGGSMHMLDKKVGFVGSTPILGSAVPIASGIAAAIKFNKQKNIIATFIGDGSAEEGGFYESVNLAGSLKLPLMIVLEDNLFSVETSHKIRKVKGYNFNNLFKKGMSAQYEVVDGQNFIKVFNKTKKLKKDMQRKQKIGILHCKVRRAYAHSGPNIDLNKKYRKLENDTNSVQFKNDAIEIMKKLLIKKGIKKSEIGKIEVDYTKKLVSKFNKLRKTIKIN